MQKVFISSPYAGDIRRNKNYASDLTRAAIASHYAPITPHLYITEALNDSDELERNKGLALALELLESCDVLFVGCDYGISRGMAQELQKAVDIGLPIYSLSYAIETIDGYVRKVVKQTLLNKGKTASLVNVAVKGAKIISTMPKEGKQ